MFVRKISFQLKPNMFAEFSRTFEKEVIPVLNKQQGFKGEITFGTAASKEVLATSLWDTQKNAELYASKTYNDVLKTLVNVIEGTPKLETTEVLHSTFNEINVAMPVAA
jgi:hypothetical protein